MSSITVSRFLVCSAMTTLSAGVSVRFSLAAVRPAQGPARALALYAFVWNLALFAASLASFVVGGAGWLEAIAASMVVVQTCDALVGVTIRDRIKTIGPFFTASVNAAALWWFVS